MVRSCTAIGQYAKEEDCARKFGGLIMISNTYAAAQLKTQDNSLVCVAAETARFSVTIAFLLPLDNVESANASLKGWDGLASAQKLRTAVHEVSQPGRRLCGLRRETRAPRLDHTRGEDCGALY